MGPRPGGRGEAKRGPRAEFVAWMLQWGRAPEGAERRSWKPESQRTARFNGAAPRRARRGPLQTRMASWSGSFNGAAPRRARRDGRTPAEQLAHDEASMGPRPGGRGEVLLVPRVLRVATLQWGRAPEGAERSWFKSTQGNQLHASMGPRPGGRGEAETWQQKRNRRSCFNGAAPRRARREPGQLRKRFAPEPASMGPRPGGRGEKHMPMRKPALVMMLQWGRAPEGAESGWRPSWARSWAWLQWGRAPEGAERRCSKVFSGRPTLASMGPRPGGRGEGVSGAAATPERVASMGPRPGGRGEQRAGSAATPKEKLQWGRAPEGAERLNAALAESDRYALQWGRAPEGAERQH